MAKDFTGAEICGRCEHTGRDCLCALDPDGIKYLEEVKKKEYLESSKRRAEVVEEKLSTLSDIEQRAIKMLREAGWDFSLYATVHLSDWKSRRYWSEATLYKVPEHLK